MLNNVMAWRFLNILTDLAQTGYNCGFRGKGDLFLSRYETFCVANTRRYHRSLHGLFFCPIRALFSLTENFLLPDAYPLKRWFMLDSVRYSC